MSCMNDSRTPLGTLRAAVEAWRVAREAVFGSQLLKRLNLMLVMPGIRRDLLELDDRLLKDIGLSRIDIEREARRHFWDVDDPPGARTDTPNKA